MDFDDWLRLIVGIAFCWVLIPLCLILMTGFVCVCFFEWIMYGRRRKTSSGPSPYLGIYERCSFMEYMRAEW
jgi:hypothetical protein